MGVFPERIVNKQGMSFQVEASSEGQECRVYRLGIQEQPDKSNTRLIFGYGASPEEALQDHTNNMEAARKTLRKQEKTLVLGLYTQFIN